MLMTVCQAETGGAGNAPGMKVRGEELEEIPGVDGRVGTPMGVRTGGAK